MIALTTIDGVAAPMADANIDTDVIMPKRFLKGISRDGLLSGVFADLRFELGGRLKRDFVLNQIPYDGARFLIVGPNFGCGSSREHAVWGMRDFGIRALIGTSFASIFYDNCFRNGLLPIRMSGDVVSLLLREASDVDTCRFVLDLPAQTITTGRGITHSFEVDQLRKALLVRGIDAVTSTLEDAALISRFEQDHFESYPWLLTEGPSHRQMKRS